MLHPLDPTQLMWTWIVGAFFGLLFVGFLRGFITTRRQIASAGAWIKVEGEIIQSEVKLRATHLSDDDSDARPVIRYRYRAGGQDREGQRLALGAGGPMERAEADLLIAKYPLGRHIDVYYDPQNPDRSALDPKSKDNLVTDAAFAIPFGAIAFVLLGQGILGGIPYLPSGLPVAVLLLPLGTYFIAAFSVVVYFLDRKQAHASVAWPTTAGTITATTAVEEQIEHKDDDGTVRHFTRYRPDLRYAYRVGERDYVGTTWRWGWRSLYASPGAAQAAIACYTQGKRVTVHYDPANPETAVLETRKGRGPVVALVYGGLWAAGGTVFLALFLYLPWTHNG